MAVTGTSHFEAWNSLQDFTVVLNYAACELLLNFLLLIDAVFSYMLVKFAHRCKLQIPCILCSRLDHILDNKKHGFYGNQLCSNHQSEVSSLFTCCIHGKLADGRGMCDECLLSFTTKTKSNPDMHRLFVGKFGFDLSGHGYQSSSLSTECVPGPMDVRFCSCCNKPWTPRQNAEKQYLPKSRRGPLTHSIPLPHQLTQHENSKTRKRCYSPRMPRQCENFGFESLSNVRCKDLKITYDSEPEFLLSDNDEVISVFREMKKAEEELKMRPAPKVCPDKLTHHTGPDQLANKSEANLDCDLCELNEKQVDQKSIPCALPEVISQDDIPPLPAGIEASVGLSTEKCELKFPLSQNSKLSALSEPPLHAPSSFNVVGDTLKASQWKSADVFSDDKQEEILKTVTAETGGLAKNDLVANRVAPINPAYMGQSDANAARRSSANSEENETSAFVANKPTTREPQKFNEAVKLFRTENPSAQSVDLHPEKIITCTNDHGDEPQIIDAYSSNGFCMPPDRVFPERSESSGLKSLDRSTVNEIEGEDVVDQLKRQVEYDRSCVNALHKELEEERNASAIAASQAMAMITRLQEEKAALQMEALQCLRMMEEEAEYHKEELEKNSDLLAEREKEIQDLEADLEAVMQTEQDKEMDLVTIGNKISELKTRLEALEIDWNSLENTLNSLQIGKEGLELVEEIAHQLHELRKMVTMIISQLVS